MARDDGHHAGSVGEAIADEVGNRVLAELAQVRRKEQCEEHVPSGPAHQVHGTAVSEERDQSGHGDERCRRHPVGGDGGAVGDGGNAGPGHVVVLGVLGPAADGDTDVEAERDDDPEQGPTQGPHQCALPCLGPTLTEVAFLVDAVGFVEFLHPPDVDADQDHEGVDGALLAHPEAEWDVPQLHLVQHVDEQRARSEANREPDGQQDGHQAQVGPPIIPSILWTHAGDPL